MRLARSQTGLASVELVLITPVLLLMMYIMVHSAKTMLTYEKRVIESRNAAYLTELYEGGEIQWIDRQWRTADESARDLEETLATGAQIASVAETIYDFRPIRPGNIPFLNGFPVQRYAMESSAGTEFYDEMIQTTRDDMDAYSAVDDPNIMTDKIRQLSNVLTNDNSKSGATVGVSVSGFVGPLGVFQPSNGRLTMRAYHTVDFSNKLDLLDPKLNSQDVIDEGYNLKAGYSDELEQMSAWEGQGDLFAGVFANTSTTEIAELGAFDVPVPNPPNVDTGIVADAGGDALDQAYADYVNNGGTKSFSRWFNSDAVEDPYNFTVNELRQFASDRNWVDPATEETLWPPNNGFDGTPRAVTITAADNLIIDRFSSRPPSSDTGSFFGTDGASFESRAMFGDESDYGTPYRYRVVGDLQVLTGNAAPWFGQPGGAPQYLLNYNPRKTIQQLIDEGVLELIP